MPTTTSDAFTDRIDTAPELCHDQRSTNSPTILRLSHVVASPHDADVRRHSLRAVGHQAHGGDVCIRLVLRQLTKMAGRKWNKTKGGN